MTKVCRLCLQKLQRGSKYFNINAVESYTGFMPYRDQLTTCIPEMALDLIPNPVICNGCRGALKSAYDFKSRCLLVEKKIRDYVENKSDNNPYDLSDISMADVSEDVSQEKGSPPSTPASELLLQLQKDVSMPQTGEIEITNVTEVSMRRVPPKRPKLEHVESTCGTYACRRCGLEFDNVGKLLLHQGEHGDDFVCNFCNQTFKSLQYLRKHNNICSKIKTQGEVNPILTKRPHLPTKAKNHLKRWLFRHTDHPYPTDHEKQILMQETNLSLLQVENWFINARRRILQDLTKLKMHGAKIERKSASFLVEEEEVVEEHPEMVETESYGGASSSPIDSNAVSLLDQQDVEIEMESDPEAETEADANHRVDYIVDADERVYVTPVDINSIKIRKDELDDR